MVYSLVKLASGVAFDVFYRRRRFGPALPPGPVLLVANHPNGLVDPVAAMLTTPRRVRFLGKAPLFRMPVLGWFIRSMGTLPVYRVQDGADTAQNERTFSAVFDALAAGQIVCLFPEGTSHSEPTLKRLKTGAARMALGAELLSSEPVGVQVVPLGLVFEHKGRFRSRMGAWVGEPIAVSDLVTERGPDAELEWPEVERLTERIAAGLDEVTVQVDRWEDLPLVELAERLWPRDRAHRLERLSAFARALRRLDRDEPERAAELRERVARFRDRLQLVGLEADELDLDYTPARVVTFVARLLGVALLAAPLALFGLAFWITPHWLTGVLARARRVEKDIVATQKLLLGMLLFPLWWVAAGAVGWSALGAGPTLVLLSVAPLAGVVTVLFGDRLRSFATDAMSFARFRSASGLKSRLRARRDELVRELERVEERLSPGSERSVPRPAGP